MAERCCAPQRFTPEHITPASAENEMASVASLFRSAMQVTPTADEEVDALPTISMVALPDELLQHIVRQACNPLDPSVAINSVVRVLRVPTAAPLMGAQWARRAVTLMSPVVGRGSAVERSGRGSARNAAVRGPTAGADGDRGGPRKPPELVWVGGARVIE